MYVSVRTAYNLQALGPNSRGRSRYEVRFEVRSKKRYSHARGRARGLSFYETAASLNSRGSLGTKTTIIPIRRDDRAMTTRGIDPRARRRLARRRRRQ